MTACHASGMVASGSSGSALLDVVGYLAVLEAESGRFLDTLARVDLDAEVSSCPGWHTADLLWHLAEVHGFWAQIVDGLLPTPLPPTSL